MEQIARDVYAHSVAELPEFTREAGQASNCWSTSRPPWPAPVRPGGPALRIAGWPAEGHADRERVGHGDAGHGGDGVDDLLPVGATVALVVVGPVQRRVRRGAVPAGRVVRVARVASGDQDVRLEGEPLSGLERLDLGDDRARQVVARVAVRPRGDGVARRALDVAGAAIDRLGPLPVRRGGAVRGGGRARLVVGPSLGEVVRPVIALQRDRWSLHPGVGDEPVPAGQPLTAG
jgi:hypothetical protein